jgi:ABC-type oligopeptide transport system ATPase subunit
MTYEEGRIVVAGLTKTYGTLRAVDGLIFTVEPGTITGFLGPNGAGKTTTLRMLLGLITPDAGTATISGHPTAPSPPPTTRSARSWRPPASTLPVAAATTYASTAPSTATRPSAPIRSWNSWASLVRAGAQCAATPSGCASGSPWPPPSSATRGC